MTLDSDKQEDEMAAMASIYDPEEFSYLGKDGTRDRFECTLNGLFTLPETLLKIKYTNLNLRDRAPSLPYLRFFVRHLPPPRLHVSLPTNYPSQSPPQFRLSVSWLPMWEASRICQRLDDLWLENEGNEILFIWMGFMKEDLLAFLGIRHYLDVSFLFTAFEEPEDYLRSDLNTLSDFRVSNDILFLNPRQYLVEYDARRHSIEFQRNFYVCKVCLEECPGQQCTEFYKCGHIFCKNCTQGYFTLKITEGDVKRILCPEGKCMNEAHPDQIRELVGPDLFKRYERLLLSVTLDSMDDVVYCPRPICQYPATKDGDGTMASCGNCSYNFCIYCRKVYHGVAPCVMTTEAKNKLIVEYQGANRDQRKLLETRYGKKQLQLVVERHLTNEYIKENTKPCPNCLALTSKIEGCNKMMCGKCQAHFCWLCGKHLTEPDPYQHFRDVLNNSCQERLFEGVDVAAYDVFEDEVEGAEGWIELDDELPAWMAEMGNIHLANNAIWGQEPEQEEIF